MQASDVANAAALVVAAAPEEEAEPPEIRMRPAAQFRRPAAVIAAPVALSGSEVPEGYAHWGCSKCKKKPHGCAQCKAWADAGVKGYQRPDGHVIRKVWKTYGPQSGTIGLPQFSICATMRSKRSPSPSGNGWLAGHPPTFKGTGRIRFKLVPPFNQLVCREIISLAAVCFKAGLLAEDVSSKKSNHKPNTSKKFGDQLVDIRCWLAGALYLIKYRLF